MLLVFVHSLAGWHPISHARRMARSSHGSVRGSHAAAAAAAAVALLITFALTHSAAVRGGGLVASAVLRREQRMVERLQLQKKELFVISDATEAVSSDSRVMASLA